jgi:hypothetical protein
VDYKRGKFEAKTKEKAFGTSKSKIGYIKSV